MRIGHGEALDDIGHRHALRAFAFHEFQARRGRVEQVAHFNARAGFAASGEGGGPGAFDTACLDENFRRLFTRCARGDRHAADGGDRRQRLTAETHRVDVEQVHPAVIAGRQFRGGVPVEREQQIVRAHAAAIILDRDAFQAARLDRDSDPAGAGIQRILRQFLDRRGRALNHFTRRDPVHDIGRQFADLGAGTHGISHAQNLTRRDGFVPRHTAGATPCPPLRQLAKIPLKTER
jgi:hypothetical protein